MSHGRGQADSQLLGGVAVPMTWRSHMVERAEPPATQLSSLFSIWLCPGMHNVLQFSELTLDASMGFKTQSLKLRFCSSCLQLQRSGRFGCEAPNLTLKAILDS